MSITLTEKVNELIKKYCNGKPELTLSIGVLENGEEGYFTYNGNGALTSSDDNGKKLYEIGSVTKTFTALLLSKMVYDGKTDFKASIGPYIGERNQKKYYPTLERLACHTSGLGRAPLPEMKLIFRAFFGKGRLSNIYSGFDGKTMEKKLRETTLVPTDYPTQYTHYGFGALGYVLGKIDGRGYKAAVTDLIRNDLRLENTYFGMPAGACDGGYSSKNKKIPCWEWNENDAMAGSDCLTSCTYDLIQYAKLGMSGKNSWFNVCLESHSEYDDTDDFGYGFIVRATNGLVWHNGSTGCFAAFFGFDPNTGRAVAVLSDYEHIKGEFSVDKIGFEIVTPTPVNEKKKASDDEEYDDYPEIDNEDRDDEEDDYYDGYTPYIPDKAEAEAKKSEEDEKSESNKDASDDKQ